ncbi:MAG: acyl-CoA dehydrogenase family protein [Acidimicrobiales bacterium]
MTGTESPSLARSLFLGRIDDDLAFPFPRLGDGERKKVDGLIADLRSYCDDHYDPRRVEADRWIPDEVLRDLADIGLLGLYVPEHHGGQALSQTGYCAVFDAIGQIDATLAVVLGVHQSIGYKGIHLYGTDEQRARFLPDLAAGRTLAAYALTEPNAGSDAYHLDSRARPQPDGSYRLDGVKRYIGNGSRAGLLTVFARTDTGAHVALLVESRMEGFEVGERHATMGLAGNDLRTLRFRDVHVPAANVLGEEGDGFRIATGILNNGRMSLGAGTNGSVRRLIDLTVDHVQDRHQFGQPLAEFELVQHKIGWMASYLYGMEAMGYLATGLVDRGVDDYRIESAMLKVAGSEFIWYAANRAFQLAGGKAYMCDEPYEKMLRDIRVFPIFEGANDVMRLFIALEGLETLGDELEGLQHLDPRHPVESLGAVAGYAGDRLQRKLSPDRVSHAHPALAARADTVTGQVQALRNAAEKLLRRHGTDVQDQQAQLKRLAHAAIEAYAQIATICRVSDVLDETTSTHGLGDETTIADTFCRRAERRAAQWIGQIQDNDDGAMNTVARAVIDRGGYAHAL